MVNGKSWFYSKQLGWFYSERAQTIKQTCLFVRAGSAGVHNISPHLPSNTTQLDFQQHRIHAAFH